jgi:TatA/E family protein of Tat protein translocase
MRGGKERRFLTLGAAGSTLVHGPRRLEVLLLMFGSLGGSEFLLIAVLALLLFGPRKLPQIGRSLGRALAEFRGATHEFKASLEREVDREHEARPGQGAESGAAVARRPSGSSGTPHDQAHPPS